MDITDVSSHVPYLAGDSTRAWVEQNRDGNNVISPQLVLRFATDSHWIHNMNKSLPAYGGVTQTKSMMNAALPGMNVWGVLNWQVDESQDNEESTASFEMINGLPVSITQTTLTSSLNAELYGSVINTSYTSNSYGATEAVVGNTPPANHKDVYGEWFVDSNVKYRLFEMTPFSVATPGGFPNPATPDDGDNDIADDNFYPSGGTAAVGGYYVLIDQEIVRVAKKDGSNNLYIPAGGRACNGILQAHSSGAPVKLLGFGPHTGEYVGQGMFSMDDYKPYQAAFRTGTCITSYEGYGKIQGPLTHQFNFGSNYTFTGYWFVKGVEDSIDDTGVPRLKVTMSGPQDLVNRQKITLDMVQRIKTNYGTWSISKNGIAVGQPLFAAGRQTRDIPGDWVDYNSWDPNQPNAYPLKIKTEIAQHKAYFDHMNDTQLGSQCPLCRSELAAWKKRTGQSPKDPKYSDAAQRSIGKHIYKESIRVQHPLQTYLRLMLTLCAMAWDHPPQGVDLAQKFTKIPNSLFNNMRNIGTGLVYNGQLDFNLVSGGDTYDWTNPSYEAMSILQQRLPVDCPFETQYDNVEFAQPIRDLADINDMNFWINRRGYPVFLPKQYRLRPSGSGFQDLDHGTPYPKEGSGGGDVGGQWFMSYGASITSYTHSIDSDSILTQVWVTATTAFDSTFTISTAGTGFNAGGKRIIFGALSGNSDGLVMTGGVQQVDTVSMDNTILGLEWDLKPAGFGVTISKDDGVSQMADARPVNYDGSPPVGENTKDQPKSAIMAIQQTINWMLERHYFPVITDTRDAKNPKYWLQIPQTGDWTYLTGIGVQKVQNLVSATVTGQWNRQTHDKLASWYLDNSHYLHFDIYWYVMNGRQWEEYVAALTGLPVPVTNINDDNGGTTAQKGALKYASVPSYTVDEVQLKQNVVQWESKYVRQATNVGNRAVNDSINKACTRAIQSNLADPRVQPGDVIWANVPGHIEDTNLAGGRTPPFSNGLYVSSISRQMDLTQGTYQASYTGYRYVSNLATNNSIPSGYDFISNNDGALLNSKD